MSLRHQQDFLARLYTDAELRRAFLLQPDKIGAENGLNKKEIAELSEVLPEELIFFAESLFWKRLREVEKLLPLTRKFLDKDFSEHLRKFSQNYNPQTVKKHLEDAIEFCKFLQRKDFSEIVRNLAKFEQTKLEFFGYGKRFAFCLLSYKIEEVLHRPNSFKPKKIIAVWLKIGGKTKFFSF